MHRTGEEKIYDKKYFKDCLVLVDTGWDTVIRENAKKYMDIDHAGGLQFVKDAKCVKE